MPRSVKIAPESEAKLYEERCDCPFSFATESERWSITCTTWSPRNAW